MDSLLASAPAMGCVHHPETETGLESCERCGALCCRDCFVVLQDRALCAACKVEHVRDLRSGIVPGALDLASVGRRLLGVWVDGLITSIGAYAILIPLMIPLVALTSNQRAPGPLQTVVTLLMYPILLGVPFVYEGWLLQRRGQTVGKMALGLKVVTPEGGQISRGQAWGRAALKVTLGSCLGVDYLPALFTRERTCLHDLIARTRVVKVGR
jgi:uncharacterized RDD family membrane protein YckC